MSAQPATPEPIDHEWIDIAPDKGIYRGHFVAKADHGRDWVVLEPAPSQHIFGRFKNIWDCEEAIDAFLDHGIAPSEEDDQESARGMSERLSMALRED